MEDSGQPDCPKRRRLQPRPTIDENAACEIEQLVQEQQVECDELVDGSYLHRIIEENSETFQRLAPDQDLCGAQKLSWGSFCSGSEAAHFVMLCVERTLHSFGFHTRFTHKFSCEKDQEKSKWIQNVMLTQSIEQSLDSWDDDGDGGQDDDDEAEQETPRYRWEPPMDESSMPCIYKDICEVGQAEARCWIHGASCRVPSVDLLILGTSCKDMSKANVNRGRQDLVLEQRSSKGGSADTFQGFLKYLDAHRPLLVIFENVDSMDEAKGGQSNLEVLQAQLRARSYEAQVVMFDAVEFGLPARRRRLYLFAVRAASNPLLCFDDRPLDRVFATFRTLLQSCQRQAPCASQVLLSSQHPAVVQELRSRQEKMAKQAKQQKKTASKTGAAEGLSLIHISEPTRLESKSRFP